VPVKDAGDKDSSWVVGRHGFASSPCECCLIAMLPIFRHGTGRRAWYGPGFWKANVSRSDSQTLDNPISRSLLKRL